MDDEEAIERVLAGDIDCFGLLVDKYQSKVLGMIYNMTRDRHLSEDLCQDVFMDAYRSLANFDSARSRFSTWLYRITQNKAINALRKHKPLLFAEVPERAIEAGGFETIAAEELHIEIDRILDRLAGPPKGGLCLVGNRRIVLQGNRGDRRGQPGNDQIAHQPGEAIPSGRS